MGTDWSQIVTDWSQLATNGSQTGHRLVSDRDWSQTGHIQTDTDYAHTLLAYTLALPIAEGFSAITEEKQILNICFQNVNFDRILT
jgi:hypothetical protein